MGRAPTLIPVEKLESLKNATQELINQEQTHFTLKGIVEADIHNIELALKKHPYAVVAEKISKALGVPLSEGTLKKYVSEIRKEDKVQSAPKQRTKRGNNTGDQTVPQSRPDLPLLEKAKKNAEVDKSAKPPSSSQFNTGEESEIKNQNPKPSILSSATEVSEADFDALV